MIPSGSIDVFDRDALIDAAVGARPGVVIHQLTDLPLTFSTETMAEARPRNARVREVGTDNLVAAAVAAGAKRIVAQSIAFAYAPGPRHVDAAAVLRCARARAGRPAYTTSPKVTAS